MSSFFTSARRPVGDIQEYLEESAVSPLKYNPTAKENVRIYLPKFKSLAIDPNNNAQFEKIGHNSIEFVIHDLKYSASKYELVPCLHLEAPLVDQQTGLTINSGNCPFCRRVSDSQQILDFRIARAQEQLKMSGIVGDAFTKQMKSFEDTYKQEQKVSYNKSKVYLLVAKFIFNQNNTPQIDTETGLPLYKWQIMRLSLSQLKDWQALEDQVKPMYRARGLDISLIGGELMATYPDTTSKRDLIGGVTWQLAGPDLMLANQYPGLAERLDMESQNFNWEDPKVVKAYPEFAGLSDASGESKLKELFNVWDRYQEALSSGNTKAVYAEYGTTNTEYPQLNNGQGAMPPQGVPYGAPMGAIPTFNGGVQMPQQGYGAPMGQQGYGATMGQQGMPPQGAPMGQSGMQMPGQGQPMGQPMGQPQGAPMGQQGMPAGLPMGQTGAPMGQQGATMGATMGQPMGQPMGQENPAGQQGDFNGMNQPAGLPGFNGGAPMGNMPGQYNN